MNNTWQTCSDILRKLRGQNLWRGNEQYLIDKQQLRLFPENRGNDLHSHCMIIHLSEEKEIYAEFQGETYTCTEDLATFLMQMTALCRGKEYLKTERKKALYRQKI